MSWILANTKSCPKCSNPGCNHVRCKCGQCIWLCGGAMGSAHGWNSISGHTCKNRFTEEETSEEGGRREAARGLVRAAQGPRTATRTGGRNTGRRWSRALSAVRRAAASDPAGWLTGRCCRGRAYVFACYMFDDAGRRRRGRARRCTTLAQTEAGPFREPPRTRCSWSAGRAQQGHGGAASVTTHSR
ncbi:unnamed protein product [Urochloa humidicola]